MRIPQELPQWVERVHVPVDDARLAAEPVFRRGDAGFVRAMGGAYAKRLLAVADALGMVTDRTRIMVQKTPLVPGAYPDIPQWHADLMPGQPASIVDTVRRRIDGLICVLVDTLQHPLEDGTLFLKGELELDAEGRDAEYRPGSHLREDEGPINWIHPAVEAQLGKGVDAEALEPNVIYRYRSDQFHRAPQLVGSDGIRVVIRLNTPPPDMPYDVPPQNTVIMPEPRSVFRVDAAHARWWRENVGGEGSEG